MPHDRHALRQQIKRHEGWREKPYLDSRGYATVGWGFYLGNGFPLAVAKAQLKEDVDEAIRRQMAEDRTWDRPTPQEQEDFEARFQEQYPLAPGVKGKRVWKEGTPLRAGFGRDINQEGISRQTGERLLDISIDTAEQVARRLFSNFDQLDDARQRVLVNMAFNIGEERLKGFKKFRQAVEFGSFEDAVKEMLDSDWTWQVKYKRAIELAFMMREGRTWRPEDGYPDDLWDMARKEPVPQPGERLSAFQIAVP